MNVNSGDTSESGESGGSGGEDKNIIDAILGEMKSEFNKSDVGGGVNADDAATIIKTEEESTNPTNNDEDKPRIILSFKKPNGESPSGRRSLRHKPSSGDAVPKRSARRRSKDCNESVLQSAIARKEKSYNEANKPQRLTRQLKPTPKILENLALAKQEKSNKVRSGGDVNELEERSDDRGHRKHKHKHSKHSKKAKKLKNHLESDSDSDGLEGGFRKSRRLSNSRFKDDSNTDFDDREREVEGSIVEQDITSRLCLCTQRTQYYFSAADEEMTYCGAVDSLSDRIVGCSRPIETKEIMLLRSSTRAPYTILCAAHRNRLLRHNCCPTCGVFCTQGTFVECESKHHYHRDCQIVVGGVDSCPHCARPSPIYDVTITLRSPKKPIFLPIQKTHCVSARMSFVNKQETEEVRCVTPPLLPLGALEIHNSMEYGGEEYDIEDLVAAVRHCCIEKVALVLGSKSVDLNCKLSECNDGTILHLASQKGDVSMVHMLVVSGSQLDALDRDQNTPLMSAILASNNDIVRYLIKAGSTLDLKGTDGMTALHLAAKCGNLKSCELLLNTGLKHLINGQDDGGWTPLVWACEHGYADIADLLIHKGADASVRDVEHNVALHWAAFSGSSHIAELLLNKGCDVNAVNAHGDTPLHIGARQDMYNCNIVLLARGADVTLLNKNNESPLDCVPSGGDSYNPISLNVTLQVDYACANAILCNDISKGKEANPIQCYNGVDSEPKPTDFQYITSNCVTSDDVTIDTKMSSLQCCQCEERCVDDECFCGKLSVQCWYDEEGKLVPDFSFTDIPMIFECNSRCACNMITCNNRVIQKGLTQRFELFKTKDKGWGVRSLRPIVRGSFVCEYVGEIITDNEADRREDDSFLFDLENRVCRNNSETDVYCIDAKFYGNFARFINHSCSPNLTSVKVFVEHQDLRFPRIAFFANRDIGGEEELSFDYGEKFWMAKYKAFSCLCGSSDCRYSEDTIEMTMKSHQRRLEECA